MARSRVRMNAKDADMYDPQSLMGFLRKLGTDSKVSLSLSLSRALSPSIYLSLSLPPSLSPSLSLSISLSLSLYIYISISLRAVRWCVYVRA